MSSHGGQQNFPFGCMVSTYPPLDVDEFTYACSTDQQENIHGLGFPEFMNPGPPPGQPLLNAHENQDLDNFFHDFDQNAAAIKAISHAQFNLPSGHDQYYGMPPMFVGSDTALGRSGVNPHQLQGGGFPYGDSLMGQEMGTVGPSNAIGSMHGAGYSDAAYTNPLIAQLQTAASLQPAYGPGWLQTFPPQHAIHMQPQSRQVVNFGSDPHFQPTGYAAPNNPMDPDIPQGMQTPAMDWFEPMSASTTQPNTQPNTEPSSPNWSKKRTFDDFQREQQPRNGFVPSTNGQHMAAAQPSPPQSNPRRKRSSVVKNEPGLPSQPPTPLTSSKPHTPLNPLFGEPGDHEEDAEAEADEDEDADDDDGGDGDDEISDRPKSPSPAPWPSNKARPPRVTKPPPQQPIRKKKSGTNPSTQIKPKAKRLPAPPFTRTPATRVPLTMEQKKANHTNSEQRRRDATARAYAELYDLVPELDDMGKQSTMKKLEVVVAKVQRVKLGVEKLRVKLGLDPQTGKPVGPGGGDVLLHSDVQS
ncbi:uncharacterized protein Z518_09583 [Rhinocladiella mackenziei CBS 650.93]|uniref:Rhinocladiella mackenziei CBS 650.93 unplaced genomic scaffold supercont1.7, whole genome shotgun sequence n=1 Tax=Rhinocladiella mackenziei CBS 650.93 TaxID=1442369 RepID=A0A0D2IF20_9EURO|nr:uncharacterized protein Z518_09583 [Rhinocladiella mackenziei CBS 650.93]KIX01856.1 hypothetical protein Z518_09583 [Rhinocladiella mackenziei CBS 650.93]